MHRRSLLALLAAATGASFARAEAQDNLIDDPPPSVEPPSICRLPKIC